MTVYVDAPINVYGRMLMCHMVSPDEAELHAMAAAIGVARRWFQDPLTMALSRPHYYIAKGKRAMAVAAGAREIDRYQMAAISIVARNRLLCRADDFTDPLSALRGKDGRPGHPELARVEAWLTGELAR